MSLLQQIRTKLLASVALVAVPAMSAALVLAPIGSAHAAAGDPASAQQHAAEAERLIGRLDYKGALIEYKNAIKADPEDGNLRLKLASLELGLNDVDSAQVDLKAAREHGADEAKLIPLLGRVYMVQGKLDQALQDFPVPNDASPEIRSATLVVRAEAQILQKHLDEARSSLIAAEELQPQSVAPKLGLARIAFTIGQTDDALKKSDELLKIAPTAETHLLRGEILNKKGDTAAAIAEFNEALKIDPTNVGGLVERAQMYISTNDDAKASVDIKAALAIAPGSVPAHYFEALILARAKDYNAADLILTKYAASYVNFPRGYYLQAVVKSSLKQYEQAEAAINAYLGAVPDDISGEKIQADVMLRKSNSSGAADVLEKVVAGSPDDAQGLAMLGQAYMQSGRPQQAVEAFEKASKLAPDNASVLRGLALNHLAQGQSIQGATELEKALALAPDDQPSSEALVLVYIRQKQYDKAAKLVDEMRKRRPDDPVPANMIGMVELSQSHLPQAEAAYSAAVKQFPDFTPARLQLGYIYSVEGRLDEAHAMFQAIVDKDPLNLAALQNLSAVLMSQRQPDQVVAVWRKSHAVQPDNVPVALGLIQAFIATKDFDSGLSVVRDMQVRQPNEPRLYAMRAELELQKNLPKDAITSLQRLIELQPQDPAARRDLAMGQDRTGDLTGAITTIAEARKLDPSNIVLAADEVRLLGKRNPDDGIAAAQKLGEQMPDQPTAQAMAGDYLQSLNRPADATAAYQHAFQAHPSLVLAERLSQAAVRDGKPAMAGKILADWAQAHPDDVPARYALAGFALDQKDWPTAKARYEALLKSKSDDPLVLNNLAFIYQREGDPRALDFAQKAYAAAPQNAAIADTLGWIMVQKADVKNGLKFIQQAYNATPADLNVQYHLAYGLNLSGNKSEAADLLKNAIAAGKDFDSKKDAETLLGQLSKS